MPSIKKSPGELKTETMKYYADTKGRLAGVKQQAFEKVHTVLGMSDSLVASLDTTMNAVESALDYLLPRQQTEAKAAAADEVVEDEKASAMVKLINRMTKLSDKIRRRVIDYTRSKWLPAIFGSVVVLKSKAALSINGVIQPVTSAAAAAVVATTTTTTNPSTTNGKHVPEASNDEQH